MRKNKQQLPIRRHLFYLTAFLLGIIILNSCTKINTDKLQSDIPINKIDISEKFFYSSQKTDATVKRVLENLKQRNDKYEFVENFVMENGYPIWNKAVISTKTRSYNSVTNSVNGQTDTIIQIPLVLPNTNKVNGFIAAVINDSINYNLYIGKDYYKYSFNDVPEDSLNADKAAMQIMLLDKAVFGYTDFAINDNRLFSNQSNYNINAPQRIIKISNNNGNSGNIVPVCESVIIDWVVIECAFYQCTVTWINTIIICPNYGGGPSGGGTTGGGSPFPPPPPGGTGVPCYGCGTGGTGSSGSPNGIGGGGLGWNPIPINSAITYTLNTLGADIDGNEIVWFVASNHYLQAIEIQNYLILNNNSTQAIALCWLHLNLMMTDPQYLNFVAARPNDIKTAYYSYLTEVENNLINPCLKSIINDIKADGHKSIIFDLYKRAQSVPDFKIKFKYEEVASLTNNAPANTTEAYNRNSQGQPTSGIMTIQLNKTALIGKSKEYITSVILHEICHAIIKSSNALNSGAPTLTQKQEHTKMIQFGYPLKIYDALKELYPNAPNATAAQIVAKDSDFKDLSIGGMADADVLFDANGVLLNNALTSLIASPNYFPGIDITNAYNNTIPAYKDLTKGTICN
jgi:hypothetical protein